MSDQVEGRECLLPGLARLSPNVPDVTGTTSEKRRNKSARIRELAIETF